MKCLVWKCCILTLALALLLVLGALAEGTIGLPLAAAVCLLGCRALRAAWAAEQRAERRAERRAALRRARRAQARHSRSAPVSVPAETRREPLRVA